MKSICEPLTPPAALICLTASLAPFAAGRSRADSSPVSAKPPPILIVPPPAAPDEPGVDEVQAAIRTIALANTKALRRMTPPSTCRGLGMQKLTTARRSYGDWSTVVGQSTRNRPVGRPSRADRRAGQDEGSAVLVGIGSAGGSIRHGGDLGHADAHARPEEGLEVRGVVGFDDEERRVLREGEAVADGASRPARSRRTATSSHPCRTGNRRARATA